MAFARRRVKAVAERAYRSVSRESESIHPDPAGQRLLAMEYADRARRGDPLPAFADAGFRVYSATDEDGILLLLFSVLGMGGRRCAEVAYGRPFGANTTNLLCTWGWDGLLIEGDAHLAADAEAFFRRHPGTATFPPKVVNSWVTAENVNELFTAAAFTGELDLLSIDIDGVDWWIWEALEVATPRVVVVEYQDIWGPDVAVTVPYEPAFDRGQATAFNYCGASLPAWVKLADRKGYRLVGANRYGFNAFFVRHGLGEEAFPAVSIESCLTHRKVQEGIRERRPLAEQYRWIDV